MSLNSVESPQNNYQVQIVRSGFVVTEYGDALGGYALQTPDASTRSLPPDVTHHKYTRRINAL